MLTLNDTELGKQLNELIATAALSDDDIGILDQHAQVKAVIITPAAYAFLLKKVEEEENQIDQETVNEFHRTTQAGA